ncbi:MULTISPECIES: phage protein NinX family protein [Pseudomonas]|uniref:phage protein NinX family protein n=1 Tax=Pseudomonas TaxID=286 RepID=UPI000760F160|nr:MULTISPECIES: phage protein NinX family protein [Pseudomonas]MDG9809497.1 DUF2591 domain-containing protein [Pseudomonas juntendi]MDG9815743.1 DUF2591 domain-containing protein [Pseudomonas putida]
MIHGLKTPTELVVIGAANLSGEALAWAVGEIEGIELYLDGPRAYLTDWRVYYRRGGQVSYRFERYNPQEDWVLGGPLADRHCKSFGMLQDGTGKNWRSFAYKSEPLLMRLAGGGSLLVALCRAIVLLHRGETVLIPKELASHG